MSRTLSTANKRADIHEITALLDGLAFPATNAEIVKFAAAHASRVEMPIMALHRVEALPPGMYYSLSEALRKLEEKTPHHDVYVCPECGGEFTL